ncbi:MAG TPA: response regulator transcription factor [Gemmatimonadaceae bacterium]|nr:response regulator transcription factor [Gemmatimonadaceae bacterium]
MTETIRVLLADDHAVVRAGLRAVLNAARDIEVVGEASSGREAIDLVERLHPDVVLMDLSMPGMDGIAATREIVARNLGARVVAVTMHSEREYLAEAMDAGAAGYVVKTDAHRELRNVVRAAAQGAARGPAAQVTPVSETTIDLPRVKQGASEHELFAKLTGRERDVLRLTGLGYSAPEIGRQLSISAKTVDTYKQRINEKIHISHRSDYVRLALNLGLLAQA